MSRPRVLALVMAGGEGGRMEVLTDRRAKPALPFAGVYRLIDLPTRDHIRELDPDVVLVLSADHVYRLDFSEVVAAHLDREADLTIVSTRVPIDQAPHHGVVVVGDDGRVTDFAHKPEDPPSDIVTTEVFAYRTTALLETLESLARELGSGSSTNLGDFGEHLVPRLVADGSVHDFRLGGYWRDLGRPETYFAAHMDLLEERPELQLDDRAWPIFTRDHQRLPARVRRGAVIENSLVSPGCVIDGTVRDSVLGPGVTVAADAVVEHAVVLADVEIREEAQVRFAVVDEGAVVGKGAEVGEDRAGEVSTEDLVLVGMGAHVRGRRKLRRGDRVEPAGGGRD